MEVQVRCGRCTGCRLYYSKVWALRCMHEAQLHERNSFITLTYSNEHLPRSRSVHKTELQKFYKRVRKHFGVGTLRYFGCGEYGDKRGRPHYHSILFGLDFREDRYIWKMQNGNMLFRSPTLEKLWKKGHCSVGSVTFESCAYVARYVMKKRMGKPDEIDPNTGKSNAQYYEAVDTETGEIINLEPEFVLMSKGRKSNPDPRFQGGIGYGWLSKFKGDTDKDFVTIGKHKMPIPRYYDNNLELIDQEGYLARKKKRYLRAKKLAPDNTHERLAAKEQVKIAQAKLLIREEF